MTIRMMVRLYIAGELDSEDSLEVEPEALESVIPAIASRQARRVAGRRFMVEFEFPDMPEADRFLRFGTDKSLMVQPVAVDLRRTHDA
ncbi:MAG TPA: hypothetical protein VK604_01400 [Bryobacteraceae bacterium]|nr:hypothetical protein [Bryobacteraceae bacterium]